MKIIYYGHSCFLVEAGGKKLLFDPYITPNPLAAHVDVTALAADHIFVSHAHFDHLHDVEMLAKSTGATVWGNWELFQYFNRIGIQKTHPINPGGQFTADFGTVKCVIAQHSSSLPDGSYGGVACGFVFDTPDGNFYYSGDTALTNDMALIPQFIQPDFAVLPIGDGLTMGVAEAVEAARMVGVSKVMGVHYDTFPFIRTDREKAIATFRDAGIVLYLPEIGAGLTV